MERYENLGLVGEGSYGMVLKCKHKETGHIVAIKKFIESEDDKMVKKIALREIKMLKQLRHENLVNLLEVFRRKKRLFLVFEFVDRTILDDLEKYPNGLEEVMVKKISFQVLRGLEFCHSLNIIHRDVKPENILISKTGVVKLCDFGFARTLATIPGEVFTDYVATRWYRAPELLVGDLNYGKAVDIWAVGCLIYEMITGDPLFPGDSDIDQLFHITKAFGNLTQKHQEAFLRNPLFSGMRMPSNKNSDSNGKRFNNLSQASRDLVLKSLSMDASKRLSCLDMMKHQYYQDKNFAQNFLAALKQKIEKETTANPLLKSLAMQKCSKFYNNNHNVTVNNIDSNETNGHQEIKESKANFKVLEMNKNSNAIKDSKVHEKAKKKLTKNTDGITNEVLDKKQKQNDAKQQQQSEYQFRQHQHVKQQRSKDNISSFTDKSTIKSIRPEDPSGLVEINTNSNSLDESTNTSKQTTDACNKKVSLEENFSKQNSDALDLKHVSRATLDLSISQPGKNLPEICSTSNVKRGRGHDGIKQKKTQSKKQLSKSEQESKIRDVSDLEFLKVSGLILPSVKGAESKNMKLSPTREKNKNPSKRAGMPPTIPHIQNIDPFSMSHLNKESPSSTSRLQRDGNFPAV